MPVIGGLDSFRTSAIARAMLLMSSFLSFFHFLQ